MARSKARITNDGNKMVKTTCTFEPTILAKAKQHTGYGQQFSDLSTMVNYLLAVYVGITEPYFGVLITAPAKKGA